MPSSPQLACTIALTVFAPPLAAGCAAGAVVAWAAAAGAAGFAASVGCAAGAAAVVAAGAAGLVSVVAPEEQASSAAALSIAAETPRNARRLKGAPVGSLIVVALPATRVGVKHAPVKRPAGCRRRPLCGGYDRHAPVGARRQPHRPQQVGSEPERAARPAAARSSRR